MAARTLDRRILLVLAIGCGVSVANNYYAQPLLDEIGHDLGVSGGAVGLLVTASQIGYALGLFFLVPLGDLLERRALIQRLCLVCAGALVVTAVAPSFAVLAGALAFVGLSACVTQVIVAAAASLAGPQERGRVVGIVMSGLLLGILTARTVSGVLADIGGWRLPFAVAAGLMLLLVVAITIVLPRHEPDTNLRYPALLASVAQLVRDEPVLRWRMAMGGVGMAAFALLWTGITFVLARDYGYGEGTIGLFGLFGIGGAAAAQIAGRFVDRGLLHRTTGAFLAIMLGSWGLLALGGSSLIALIAGVVLLDLGIQGQQICSQSAIFNLLPNAGSRVTTAYMGHNFLWGAAGSAAASFAFAHGGWSSVVTIGGALAAVGLLAWVGEQAWLRRTGQRAVFAEG